MTCRTAAFFSLHLEKALEPSEGFPVTPQNVLRALSPRGASGWRAAAWRFIQVAIRRWNGLSIGHSKT